jgi:hypothetical protein
MLSGIIDVRPPRLVMKSSSEGVNVSEEIRMGGQTYQRVRGVSCCSSQSSQYSRTDYGPVGTVAPGVGCLAREGNSR